MYIYKYTHTHTHTQPKEHHGNWTYSKQTSNHSNTTLHSVPYNTLYIKAWGVIDVKHQLKIHWEMKCTDEWNACLWNISITPPRQIINNTDPPAVTITINCILCENWPLFISQMVWSVKTFRIRINLALKEYSTSGGSFFA